MQCKCGAETKIQTHTVTTLPKAVEWYSETVQSQLPLEVEQEKCICGRMMRKIYSNGELIYHRG